MHHVPATIHHIDVSVSGHPLPTALGDVMRKQFDNINWLNRVKQRDSFTAQYDEGGDEGNPCGGG